MSVDYYHQQVQHAQKEIARLQQEKGREADKIADISRKINTATQSLNRSSSASTAGYRTQEIARYRGDEARANEKIADLENKIAREQKKLADAEQNLVREQERESRQQQQLAERQARGQENRIRQITGTLDQHAALHRHTLSIVERLSQLPDRIVVLFLAANPLDQEQLRLDEEARSITEMIRKSKHRDAVRLESCWAVRPLDVLQAINEHRPRIVHFSGHGSDRDEIMFQDDSGQAKAVTKEAIVQAMAATSGDISLVFFNTCYSRNQAEAVVEHVEAAIGMKTAIGDQAARVFAAQFYSAIGFGLSVQTAFDQARAALMLVGIPEQDTPELFVAVGVDANGLVLVRPPDALDDARETAE